VGLTFEPLSWDSEFFGFPIARVVLDDADETSLREVAHEARAAGITCLYGYLDALNVHLSYTIQALGWRLVDVATTFSLSLREPPIARPPETEFRVGTVADVEAVTEIAEQMAEWSRFAADPRFGIEAARRLQRSWVDRAVGPSEDHTLMVAEQESGIVALIGRVATPQPRVDAVGTTKRGSGAARYLIQGSREWAHPEPLLGGPIASRNVAALRYVSHCGYRASKVEYLYHHWLDERTP
jgi:dTDP-4-amino-4,6-dideoxy-D-galactose acyltransferase